MTNHYHIGQNIPGYMPERDVYIVTTKRDAVAALIDEKKRVLESDMGYHDSPPRKTLHCVGSAREDLFYHITDDTKTYDLGLSLWAYLCDEPACLEPCHRYPGCDIFAGEDH